MMSTAVLPNLHAYTDRIALSMANRPSVLPCAPLDAAERPEKSATIPVAVICKRLSLKDRYELVPGRTIPNLRPSLSDMKPNDIMPRTVPAKVRLEMTVLCL